MNFEETANALALAQAYDNRTVGEANIRAWHLVLGDLDAGDVMEAIRRHHGTESAWIMPAHIVRLVGEIGRERAKAARQWAPGQYGVPKDEAAPEIERAERLTAADVSPRVVELLDQLRTELPDVPRERLFPREAYWDRQQRAHARQDATEPPRPNLLEQARDWCRANGAHDSGLHVDICPDATAAPVAARCSWCGCDSQDIAQHLADYPGGSCR